MIFDFVIYFLFFVPLTVIYLVFLGKVKATRLKDNSKIMLTGHFPTARYSDSLFFPTCTPQRLAPLPLIGSDH